MDDPIPPDLPAPPEAERCYRHGDEETLVHCTRCGRPICPRCMIPAPVGHHCPECVAEASREFRKGAGRRMAVRGFSVTKAILAITVAAFVLEVATGGAGSLMTGPGSSKLVDLGAAFPPLIANGQWWRLLSPALLHFGIFHIAINMYALYLFGPQVERDFGKLPLVVIYLISDLAGNVAQYAFGPVFAVAAGASGAIFGLLGAFLAYNYRRRHTALGRSNVQWVWQILILNAILSFSLSGIGYLAHLGGFVAGAALGVAFDVGQVRRREVRWVGVIAIVALSAVLVMWRTPMVNAAVQRFLSTGALP
ncbi:MAG: rhomboid family intramembrane serine protease [Actinobacteria bacterium]|nr:rhomboid family intramembrane serine protease [Actinomycetota bacterium]